MLNDDKELQPMRTAALAGLVLALLSTGCSMKATAPAEPVQEAAQAPGPSPAAASVPAPRPAEPPVVTRAEPGPSAPPATPSDAAKSAKSEAQPAKAPARTTAAGAQQAPKKEVAQEPAKKEVAPEPAKKSDPPLDLASLETRLKETKAIGIMTKIALKNQVDDLLNQFRGFYAGKIKTTLAELRKGYDLLVLKVLSLLQDNDPSLAAAIVASREAIWGILSDRVKFANFASN
jgi:hypothetical protein